MAVFYLDRSKRVLGDVTGFGAAPPQAYSTVDLGAAAAATVTKLEPGTWRTLNLEEHTDQFFLSDLLPFLTLPVALVDIQTFVSPRPWRGSVQAAVDQVRDFDTDYEAGDTVDGYVLVKGDRILVLEPATVFPGVYVIQNFGSPHFDAVAAVDLKFSAAAVREGVEGASTVFKNTSQEAGNTNVVRVEYGDSFGGLAFTDVRLDNSPDSAAPVWGGVYQIGPAPRAHIYASSDVVVGNATFDVVPFDSEISDDLDLHNNTAFAITAATQATPCQVTSVGHGLNTGDDVYIQGVVGMIALNAYWGAVTVVDVDNYTLDGSSTAAGPAYTSGGTGQGLPARITVDRSGVYSVTVQLSWEETVSLGVRSAWLRKNGSDVTAEFLSNVSQEAVYDATIPLGTVQQLTWEGELATGDYVEVVVYNGNGSTTYVKGLLGASPQTWMSCKWVRSLS